eukprot:2764256-Prymnesium_polylepis.1
MSSHELRPCRPRRLRGRRRACPGGAGVLESPRSLLQWRGEPPTPPGRVTQAPRRTAPQAASVLARSVAFRWRAGSCRPPSRGCRGRRKSDPLSSKARW